MKRSTRVLLAIVAIGLAAASWWFWKRRCDRCATAKSTYVVTGQRPFEQLQEELLRRRAGIKSARFARYTTKELISAYLDVKSIYGDDNQVNPSRQFFLSSAVKRNIAATVALIPCNYFKPGCGSDAREYQLIEKAPVKTLCCDVRYAGEMAPAICTGVLISPTKIATARHCLFVTSYEKYVVFDLKKDFFGRVPEIFTRGVNLFKEQQDARSMSCPQTNEDWAVLTLESPVERTPVVLGDGHPGVDTPLYSAGHPLGHPVKYVPGAKVRTDGTDNFFVANLDGFKTSSGSPVFDARTDKVEGIWVRGETPLIRFDCDPSQYCYEPLVCGDDTGRGEDITRISLLRENCAHPKEPNNPAGPAEPVVCDGTPLSKWLASSH